MMNAMKWFVKERKATSRPSQLFATMLRDSAIYRVSGHSDVLDVFAPTLQISRQGRAGARYIQMKYLQRPNAATAQRIKVHVTTVSANSAQMRRRTRLLRTEKESKRRLAGKQTANKTFRDSARKMRPDISSTVARSFERVAKIRDLAPSRDTHDAFDERRDRD